MTLAPADPLSAVRGVGAAGSRALAAAGLNTVGDLLWCLPYRYEDRANPRSIGSLTGPMTNVTVVGRLVQLAERRARNRRLRIIEAVIDDGTGALPIVWFNQPYLVQSLKAGQRVWLHGALRPARSGWGVQLVAPEWEVEAEDDESAPVHLGRIVPIYRRMGSVTGRRLRVIVARVLESLAPLEDRLRGSFPAELGLPSLDDALRAVHFPVAAEGAALQPALDEFLERRSPPHRRLALEELLALAVVLERERAHRLAQRAPACVITEEARERGRRMLPFRLTAAQKRVVSEIVADLQRPFPMARLLQGDVGSGKTIVATLAALVVVESGHQAALLAPTELLAQQHHATLSLLLADTPYRPELLIGSLPAREKQHRRAALIKGDAALVIGTHALLEDDTAFERLGLAVIDEQHRFGVAQRQALLAKGDAPHLLVMTATPIPRSLALSLYGDLDVSLLDELPPGRRPIMTVLRGDEARPAMIEFLRGEIADGGQIYWVFPLIEESEKLSLKAVETHVRIVRAALRGIEVGVVHGRLGAADREAVMGAFASGALRVLCATTVIEVGVDVPAATVMVIENAERFGLAQLHQLRGRVGRGRRRSLCVLLVGPDAPADSLERLELFASTNDGFRIAEEDFRLRGPGEFTGLRQWGRPEFRVASLWLHRPELEAARAIAAEAARRGGLDALERLLEWGPAPGATVRAG